jgi:hypothetical protein
MANDSGALAPGFRITARARGYCWTTSIASPRSNAYRCFRGQNAIYDPCFSTPGNVNVGWVACATGSPLARTVVRIQLTRALPKPSSGGHGASLPFAVRLALGRTCGISTGANSIVKGRAELYYCAGGGGLAAKISETGKHWTAWFLPSQSAAWRRVAVRTVVF